MQLKNRRPLTERELRLLIATKYDDLTTVFPGYTRKFLAQERRKAVEALPLAEILDRDAERTLGRSEQRETERRYKAALQRVSELERELEVYRDAPEVSPHVMVAGEQLDKREAAAVVLASDWHAEEKVTAEQTNGLNAYTLDVFAQRSEHFFRNTLKLLRKEAQDITIRNLVLWLGGDFLSGNIHADIAENCQLGPMDALALVQDTLAGGLELLLKETPAELKLLIPTSVGNHSRVTKEQRVATEHANSLEWLLYLTLARFFKSEKRVTFVNSRSTLTYLDVLGTKVRFLHGHVVRYQDGVGGLTIPLSKKIANWDRGQRADLTCLGHFHTLVHGPNFVANGSLIGYAPFSVSIGAPFQKPAQAFFLVDAKHGVTVRAPVLLEAA